MRLYHETVASGAAFGPRTLLDFEQEGTLVLSTAIRLTHTGVLLLPRPKGRL